VSDDPVVRSGTHEDAETVLRLWREADAVVSTTDDVDALRILLERDPDALLIAEVADEPVGTLIVGWDGWRANLYRLAILPAWRRRSIARRLVVDAEGPASDGCPPGRGGGRHGSRARGGVLARDGLRVG
jgi:ribosomal protein S18 acetylase RimI-like enzyme